MAYLNQDEEETKGQGLNQALGQPQGQPQQEQPQEAPQQSTGSAMIGGDTTQPSAPMPQQKQQKAGTGTFTNLRNYLQANQGNRVSSAAAQRVANVGAGAQKSIGQAQSAFGKRVEQGSLANMGTARQEAADITKVGTQATYQSPQAQQTTEQAPVQASPFSEEQKQRFAEIINAQYKGPQSLQQAGLYEPSAQKVRTAAQAAKQTQSAAGREQLLKETFGRNRDYTRGQSKLDALLLNTSEQGVKALQEQGAEAAKTQGALDTAQNVSSNLATQRAKDIEAIRTGAREDFTGSQTGLETGISDRITAMTTAVAKDANGKPIQKRDAAGKPMVDATGKPVYLTEWERLPQHFRDAMIDKEKNNKAMIQAQLKEFDNTGKYAPAKKAYDAATKEISGLEDRLKQLRLQEFASARDQSMTGDNRRVQLAPQIAEAEQALEAAKLKYFPTITGFKNIEKERQNIANQSLDQLRLSPEEAAMLGLSSGTGLYNLTADAIKTGKADETKLISKDELTRLQALSQLAGLDTAEFGNKLKTQIMGGQDYSMDKAGTQSALDALDRAATQKQILAAEKAFAEQAKGQNITGYGSKKNKTSGKRYYAEETANMAKVLRDAGYDFKAPKNKLIDAKKLADYIQGSRDSDVDPDTLKTALESGIRMEANPEGPTGVYTDDSNLLKKAGYAAADVGSLGITAGLRSIGLDAPGAIMGGIDAITGGSIFGGGASSKESKSDAARFAREDLQKKMAEAIQKAGFYDRVNVQDNAQTKARAEALAQLLASRDKTNR